MNGNNQLNQWQEALINQKDFLPAVLQKFLQEMLENELSSFLGAREYERTDSRKGYRNGSYGHYLIGLLRTVFAIIIKVLFAISSSVGDSQTKQRSSEDWRALVKNVTYILQ